MNVIVTMMFSFTVIVLVLAAMGIGVIVGRAPIKGSCGGLNGGRCELCSGRCRQRNTASEED